MNKRSFLIKDILDENAKQTESRHTKITPTSVISYPSLLDFTLPHFSTYSGTVFEVVSYIIKVQLDL